MKRLATIPAAVLLILGLAACEEEAVSGASAGATSAARQAKSPKSPKPRKSKGAAGPAALVHDAGLPPIDFQELDFSESERSRDPFRAFTDAFKEEAREQVKSQRDVVLGDYSIDELVLSAIVLGANPSRAMLVDPRGKGHVVHRGQFVGRPETVLAEGQTGPAYEVNWRIDQIRAGDVVFVREDPNNPDVPSATKVVELHPAEDAEALE